MGVKRREKRKKAVREKRKSDCAMQVEETRF